DHDVSGGEGGTDGEDVISAAGHGGGESLAVQIQSPSADVDARSGDEGVVIERDVVKDAGLNGAGGIKDRADAADPGAGDVEVACAVIQCVDVGPDVECRAVGDVDVADRAGRGAQRVGVGDLQRRGGG